MDGGTFLVLIIAGLIYFIPALNAVSRKHNSGAAITAANLFFGWTIIGWLLCLVWSYSGNRPQVQALRLRPDPAITTR